MNDRKLRVAIVGCGGIAREHAAAYRASGEAEVVAVHDVNAAAASAFATECGARAVSSLEELAGRDRPDAVSICTPPGVHLANCLPLLAAQIPILCEKPLAATVDDAQALAAAASSGPTFMTAFCHRFHPPVIALKRLIDAGTLGAPLLFRNIFAGFLDLTGNHRINKALSGGGTLIDNGSHSADLFRHLVGEPTHVQALTATVMQAIPVEDFCLMHFRTAGCAHGEVTLSHSLKVSGNWVEWYGTKGTAVISYWNEGSPDLAYRLEGQDAWTPVDPGGEPERFDGEIRHFLGCARSGRRPAVGAADGLATARIVDAAYRSAASGRLEAVSR